MYKIIINTYKPLVLEIYNVSDISDDSKSHLYSTKAYRTLESVLEWLGEFFPYCEREGNLILSIKIEHKEKTADNI